MSTSIAVLLGGNSLNRGVVEKFQASGLKVIVVDWNRQPELGGDLHLRVDVKDTVGVLAALQTLGNLDVRLAYTSIDVAVPTAMAIHKRYGLVVPEGCAQAGPLTKSQMTDAWRRDRLLNRLSTVVRIGDQGAWVRGLEGRELIIKPNLCSSSRGISILDYSSSAADTQTALRRAQATSMDGQAIVEEFVHGREFTVEMLGDSKGNVAVYAISVKYHTRHAGNNKVACKLHYNSSLYPEETYSRIADWGCRCYRSLGLSCCFGHLEILLRDDGSLSPVEIGARSSGFIASSLVNIASGRDYLGDFQHVLQGGTIPEGRLTPTSMSSMYFFYDFPTGIVCQKEASLLDHLHPGIKSLYHDRSAIKAGSVYGTLSSDNERHGYEILCGNRATLTMEAVDTAEGALLATMFGEGGLK